MEPDSKSIKKALHHHIITRSLMTMDFCDGNLGKITNNLTILEFCDDFDIICRGMREYSTLYWGILSIMKKHMYTIKPLQPDVLSESDYLPIYATFQSYSSFFDKITFQKQATATLKNSKTLASSIITQILHTPTHRSIHPYGSTSATTLSVVALRHYECNSGQITINKKIKTIHVRRHFTNRVNMCSPGSDFMIRTLT